MKKQLQSTLFAACILTLSIGFAACRSEAPEKPASTIEVGGANIRITAGEEPYGRQGTRTPRLLSEGKTVEMGDGLTATVSIEEDAAEDTRATKNLDGGGIYTIFAVDPATHQKIVGADGRRKTLKGKFVNGNFVPTEGALTLGAGTYKFVCINEAIEVDPVTNMLKYGNGKDAMLGITETKTITAADRDYSIHFTMKHLCTRIRVKLMTYKQDISSIKAQFITKQPNYSFTQPLTTFWNTYPDGTLHHKTGGVAQVEVPFHAAATANTALGYEPFIDVSEYQYLLPNEPYGKYLTLQFTNGTIYEHSLAGKETALGDIDTYPTAASSHTIRFALTPYPVYLFTDGTVGLLEDANGRTPVGLVARHKKGDSDNKKKGLAIALQNAGVPGEECFWSTINNANVNDHQANDAREALDDFGGYHYTWDAMQGYTKANEQTRFPAFYYAAHYAPVTIGANISKWFLPSIGEWTAFWKMVKFKVETDITAPNTINLKNGPTVADLNQLFTQAGGTPLLTRSPHNPYSTFYNAFHTSTERDHTQAGMWFVDSRDPNVGFTMNPGSYRQDTEDMYVRSFVHF